MMIMDNFNRDCLLFKYVRMFTIIFDELPVQFKRIERLSLSY